MVHWLGQSDPEHILQKHPRSYRIVCCTSTDAMNEPMNETVIVGTLRSYKYYSFTQGGFRYLFPIAALRYEID